MKTWICIFLLTSFSAFANDLPNSPCQGRTAEKTVATETFCADSFLQALGMVNAQLIILNGQSRDQIYFEIIDEIPMAGKICLVVRFYKCVKLTADLEVGKRFLSQAVSNSVAALQTHGWQIDAIGPSSAGKTHLQGTHPDGFSYLLILNEHGKLIHIQSTDK